MSLQGIQCIQSPQPVLADNADVYHRQQEEDLKQVMITDLAKLTRKYAEDVLAVPRQGLKITALQKGMYDVRLDGDAYVATLAPDVESAREAWVPLPYGDLQLDCSVRHWELRATLGTSSIKLRPSRQIHKFQQGNIVASMQVRRHGKRNEAPVYMLFESNWKEICAFFERNEAPDPVKPMDTDVF